MYEVRWTQPNLFVAKDIIRVIAKAKVKHQAVLPVLHGDNCPPDTREASPKL